MKQLLTAIAFFVCAVGIAQKEKGYAYVNKYKDIAITEMQRTGVPAAITLAQGILESQFGESDLCIKSNNHFGIKCKTEWTGDKVYHNDDIKHECFRVYSDAEASFKDHSDFLKKRPYYTALFQLSPTDVEGWCFGLKKAGYAVEKDYPQKLLKIISDYNLHQYTLIALQQPNADTVIIAEQKTTVAANPMQETVATKENIKVVIANVIVKDTTTITTTNYPDGIFTINHAKAVYAKAGTSLLLMANQYDLDLSKLFNFNDMDEASVLTTDKLIFLEKKMKKGAGDFHIVIANETLHDICQKEGVQLESILQFNSLRKNMQPITGEKIYLRSNAVVVPKTSMAENNASR